MLKIYNTLGRELQEFEPIELGKVSFYHCGPTVYWVQHIGNMRAMTLADLVRRSLMYMDYEVKMARNYTDVGHLTDDGDEGEDKMAKGAERENLTPQQIADKYIKLFNQDITALNTIMPEATPRATEYIQPMIDVVQVLLDKGYAYATPKAVYFDVSKFDNYTALSGQKLDQNIQDAGKAEVSDPDKKHPADFSVWFFKTGKHENAIQYWESPFESSAVENGEGFPGWHLECSVMANAELGKTIDIHMGGIEHIPVHHPNEIAQSEAANDQTFVNYWLHNEHLLVDGGKMAKSEGTSYTLEDITEKGYDPLVLRYFFMQAHYRSKQNFTWEAMDAAQTAYQRMLNRVRELYLKSGEQELAKVSAKYKAGFVEGLEDDFNVPHSLAIAWDLLKDKGIEDDAKLATILDFDRVLGLELESKTNNPQTADEVPDAAQELLKEREQARAEKDWAKSDEIRDRLLKEFSVIVKDTSDGPKTAIGG